MAILDCQEPPRVFVLDDDCSLMALVCLIYQHQPLFGHRRTGLRVDLVPAGVEPCREKDCVEKSFEKKKKKESFVLTQQNCCLYRHENKHCPFFLVCNVKFILLHLIKTTFFTYLLFLLCGKEKFSVLTKVSVGDDVPVVLTAVTLNLLPVTMISRCLIELHCVSGVTSWVA